MARTGRPKNKPGKVDDVFQKYRTKVVGVDPASQAILENMLLDYAWLEVTVEELKAKLDEEGLILDTEKGSKENPAFALLIKATGRKQEFFAKIFTETRKTQGEQEDSLMDFIS